MADSKIQDFPKGKKLFTTAKGKNSYETGRFVGTAAVLVKGEMLVLKNLTGPEMDTVMKDKKSGIPESFWRGGNTTIVHPIPDAEYPVGLL